MTVADVPTLSYDPFTTNDPDERYAQYRELRAAGPVVHLSYVGVYATGRYDEVKAALGEHDTFISGEGVGFNDIANDVVRGSTLGSDSPEHEVLRGVVATGLQPRAMRARHDEIAEIARGVVGTALARGDVDGVAHLAQAMPTAVVPDILGLPDRHRDELITWAKGGTDLLGPVNERTPRNAELSGCISQFAVELVEGREFAPGSLGDQVLSAADRGEIAPEKCVILMNDYLGPSMETTATAIGHLLVLFAQHPEQWEALRAQPGLVGSAINEVLRFQSPVRGFTRVARRDTALGGILIPAGARLWTVVASANRDERHWNNPDVFDFRRNPIDHLAFGYGSHGCAGQGVARLEMHALIHALLDSVERFELTAAPVVAPNSMLNTWDSVPLRLVPRGE
ncbi:cytochrome P450 [uncultured Microbacterium sp.]|uniref:cytochrome P450 n=1 Tax=uncultured Microbacterium sp. TaxID=191216 RepID=UPI002601C6B5|nr:cytochrome P450 [uncultured Microbacterium sp.]